MPNNINPSKADEIRATVLTHAFLALGRAINGMSDKRIIGLLSFIRKLVPDPAARAAVEEMIDALSSGPPNTTLFRRLVSGAKYEEVHDLFMGTFSFRELDPENL